jgi:hypothetical protein
MANLSDVRREVATAMFGERDDALRERLKATYSLMKEEAGPHHSIRQGAPAPASPVNVGIMVVTAMLGGAPQTAYRRVKRIWEAEFEGPQTLDPATGGRQFGWAMKTLLTNADARAHLDHLTIIPSVSVASLVWTNQTFSLFHPFDAAEWERIKERVEGAVALKLPVRAFHRLAALIEQ